MPEPPANQYRSRLESRQATHIGLSRQDARISYGRLAMFGLAALLAALGWLGVVTYWLLLLPVAGFAALLQRHDRVTRARDTAARAIDFYRRGLARIEDQWIGTGEPGDRFLDERHLYAHDLDLFGRGSLFELLSIARTRGGEDRLAAWLRTPAAPDELAERHAAVRELTPALDLREDLSTAGSDFGARVDTDTLIVWAESPEVFPGSGVRALVMTVTVAAAGSAAYWLTTSNAWPLGGVVLVASLLFWTLQGRVEQVSRAASGRARELETMADVLKRLEAETFSSARLARLRALLETRSTRASRIIRRLQRMSEFNEWKDSLRILPVALLLLGYSSEALVAVACLLLSGPHVALAVESWRREHGRQIRGWLEAVGEFEALSSISAYRFEHPDDPFPEILEPARDALPAAVYDGVGLGHPLLPGARTVRNDVSLASPTQLLVVSGSNMSGKSTLLRTVGINAVLALAGAPVRAHSLRLSPLAIGATLRIQDSLQEGRSRFYAEVTRIRELTDTARGPLPLLFLLDELFHGTNSHDRVIGSSGVLRSLLDRGALGLITTHDLALTDIARALVPRAVNVHFDDWFDEGEIRFDYRMKPGPVTRSNAIALMQAVGLDVPESQLRGLLL
jgi:hypothetical protein